MDEGNDTRSDEPFMGMAWRGCRCSPCWSQEAQQVTDAAAAGHTHHTATLGTNAQMHAKDTTGPSGAPHLCGSSDEVHQVQCALDVGHMELLTAHQLGAGWRVADLQSQTNTGRVASPQCTLPSACTLQARSLLDCSLEGLCVPHG